MDKPPLLEQQPLHLGLGATAIAEPPFTGMDWYAGYAARHAADGAEGRLVTLHRFDQPWDSWEMHPAGAEVLLCLEGAITLVQDRGDGRTTRVTLRRGEYAINPPGVWHTADVDQDCAVLFITAGHGTQHRAR